MKRAFLATIPAAVFFFAAESQAQTDAALAEQLFRDAQALMADHKTAEACPKFAESQRLAPTLGTQLNLARCHEENGQIATAWGEYIEIARVGRNSNDTQRATIAKERATELEKKLSKVAFKTDSKDKLTIKIDGVQVS